MRRGGRRWPKPTSSSSLRQLKDQDAERIGEEVLDGRRTQVYRLKKADFMDLRITEPEVAKVWVDPKTSLPVRIAYGKEIQSPRRI